MPMDITIGHIKVWICDFRLEPTVWLAQQPPVKLFKRDFAFLGRIQVPEVDPITGINFSVWPKSGQTLKGF